jgi:hypothetical protein
MLGGNMGQAVPSRPGEAFEKALSYMEVALELLDGAGAPADIGAHLDLALCRLREVLASTETEVTAPLKTRL